MTERRIIANDIVLEEVSTLLAEGKKVRLRAKGGSMRPAIRSGEDVIVLAPAAAFSKGDIVLARLRDGRYVVHRIVGIDGGRITLAGDANLFGREYCCVADVAGIVEAVEHRGRERRPGDFRARTAYAVRRMMLPLRRVGAKLRLSIRKIKGQI